eukprot:7150053-Pyramimonas_sp.AAC.1
MCCAERLHQIKRSSFTTIAFSWRIGGAMRSSSWTCTPPASSESGPSAAPRWACSARGRVGEN